MVVAIMTLLFALVIFAAGTIRTKMHIEATKAMIYKLRDRLEEYRTIMGSYPPDGYDFEVKNKQGTPIRGAACLYYFLTKELEPPSTVGGRERTEKRDALMSFKETELTKEDPEFPGALEVIDGFGLPFHYDNTENNEFRPDRQGEVAHMQLAPDHPPDPRTSEDTQVLSHQGIQRRGAYDLWSHGSTKAHDDAETPMNLTIGTWNVDVDKKGRAEEKK